MLLALFSCELEEEVLQKNNYRENIKIRNSTFDALLNEQHFVNAISKLSKSKPAQSKTVMEAEYGFTILPDQVKVLEHKGKTFYTFQIKREVQNPDYFENLVIDTDSIGQTDAYLFKYLPTEPLAPSEEHDSFHFKGAVHITPITYNIAIAEKELHCVTATVMMCDQSWSGSGSTTPHVATQYCNNPNHLTEVTTTTCDMTAGGGSMGAGAGGWFGANQGSQGSDPGGGHAGAGNGSGTAPGSNTNPPVLTAPVFDLDLITKCKTISKQMAKFPGLKQSLIDLAATTSDSHENGIFIDKSATAETPDPVQTVPVGSGGTIDINLNPPSKYTMIAHTHDISGTDGTGTFSIFSSDDMATISNLIQLGKIDTGDFVFYVFTADGTRYAITINCTSCLEAFCYPCNENLAIGTVLDMPRVLQINALIDQTYNKADGIHSQSDPVNDKKKFLEFIKEANLGISLFEVDETLTAFEKLELDPKTKNVIKKPCSN